MDWDDVRPKPASGAMLGENLEKLSVSDLETRLKALELEAARVSAELTKKKAHEAAASKLFKP